MTEQKAPEPFAPAQNQQNAEDPVETRLFERIEQWRKRLNDAIVNSFANAQKSAVKQAEGNVVALVSETRKNHQKMLEQVLSEIKAATDESTQGIVTSHKEAISSLTSALEALKKESGNIQSLTETLSQHKTSLEGQQNQLKESISTIRNTSSQLTDSFGQLKSGVVDALSEEIRSAVDTLSQKTGETDSRVKGLDKQTEAFRADMGKKLGEIRDELSTQTSTIRSEMSEMIDGLGNKTDENRSDMTKRMRFITVVAGSTLILLIALVLVEFGVLP